MNKERLIRHLKANTRILRTTAMEEAFRVIDRKDFVRPDYVSEAYEDYPLPIGEGQTISQPTTVVFMLELLDPKPGEKILDVGSGSGWTTALLAKLVGPSGKVFGVEKIPDLVSFGQKNLEKYSLKDTSIVKAGKDLGLPNEAPFDKIMVSAAAEKLPTKLVNQLKPGGIMVIPIRDSICKVTKRPDSSLEKKSYPGFMFVPLVGGM